MQMIPALRTLLLAALALPAAAQVVPSPLFNDRLKPLQPMLAAAAKSNEAALSTGVSFLEIIQTAFKEWDTIVMIKEPTHHKTKTHP